MQKQSSHSSQLKQGLTVNLSNQILKLQELFHSKYLTTQLLNQLIALYVAAVQCFDGAYTPMRAYFLGKIQLVLSRQQIIKMLSINNGEEGKIRDTLRISNMGMSNLSGDIIDENNKHRQIKAINYDNVNDQVRNKQRNHKIEMQMKLMRQVEATVKKMAQQVKNIDLKEKQQDKAIVNLIQKQEDMLNKRLQNRKKKLRKKSASNLEQMKIEEPLLNKQELISVHKELTEAVSRFTLRITQRLSKAPQQKGKITLQRKDSESDQDEKNIIPKYEENNTSGFKKKSIIKQPIQQKQQIQRVGTTHDPRDKGRVTVRKRSQSQQEN